MLSKGLSRTFVVGDIHGAYKALRQCLERSQFDFEKDFLICLGDVCDGWPETKLCIDELLKIENLTYILGNHDICALHWMTYGKADRIWRSRQGGEATIQSYKQGLPNQHIRFLRKALPFFLNMNKLFVHAGIDPQMEPEEQTLETLLWDRTLAKKALSQYDNNINYRLIAYDEVYVGHTPIPAQKPIYSSGVWLMDTGAGWSGVLSLMNIDTKEVFTSDFVHDLYPEEVGRKK
jgi:serine/threonine protein phosphatase 1